MAASRNAVPRSLLPLLLLLAAAVVWLVVGERRGPRSAAPDSARSAGAESAGSDALLPFAPSAAVRLDVTLPGRRVVLARAAGQRWRLEGEVADEVDSSSVLGVLRKLRAERLVALEGGGGGDLAEMGLAGGAPPSLRVERADGPALELAIGAYNPVLDRCYAQEAGRAEVFTVATSLVELLRSLPEAVRLRWLWPKPAVADVETVAVRPAGAAEPDHFARDPDGRWWVSPGPGGDRRAGPLFAAYDRLYADRRRVERGQIWWRADDAALTDMIFQLGESQVERFGPSPAPPESLRAAGLAPAPLAVRLALRGGTERRAEFGRKLPGGDVWARRGAYPGLLVVTGNGAAAAGAPLASLLDLSALPFSLSEADSLRLERPGRTGVVRGRRDGKTWRLAQSADSSSAARRNVPRPEEILGDLVTTLSRLNLTRPLPPVPAGRDPLSEPYRAIVTVWSPGREPATAQLGLLPEGRGGRAACWSPQTGRLVEVPRDILATLKGMFLAMGPGAP